MFPEQSSPVRRHQPASTFHLVRSKELASSVGTHQMLVYRPGHTAAWFLLENNRREWCSGNMKEPSCHRHRQNNWCILVPQSDRTEEQHRTSIDSHSSL
jgi:hypothetical protein